MGHAEVQPGQGERQEEAGTLGELSVVIGAEYSGKGGRAGGGCG